MKLSKSPDIKISLNVVQKRRSQKCVFKKMKLSKSPDISKWKVSKMCVQKMKLSKSPDIKISSTRKVSKMCVQKNETLKKS